jgi:hypothetical protein
MLIPCPECKQEVSSSAPTCPHCGHPLKEAAESVQPALAKKRKRLSKAALFIIVGAVAGGVVGGLKQTWYEYRSRQQQDAHVLTQIDKLKAEAVKERPDLPADIALQEKAKEITAAKIATQSADKKAETAADMYIGFLLINTKTRPAFCKEQGIDIPAWTAAFEKINATETAKARQIHSKVGFDEDRMYAMFADQMNKMVSDDMNGIATDNKGSLQDACKLFQDQADERASEMSFAKLQPAAYKALMTP